MEMMDILGQMGGMQSMARELGISESQAASGAAALLPAILGGLKKQTQAQPSGLDGLVGMLNGLGGAGLLDEVLGAQPTDVSRGHDALGQIFGSQDVGHAVTQHASGQTGLNPELLKKMLPMLAMLVAGFLAKQHSASAPPPASTGGDLGGLLGGLLGGGAPAPAPAGGGLASVLDLNGDGNPLDDILRMAGKLMA